MFCFNIDNGNSFIKIKCTKATKKLIEIIVSNFKCANFKSMLKNYFNVDIIS